MGEFVFISESFALSSFSASGSADDEDDIRVGEKLQVRICIGVGEFEAMPKSTEQILECIDIEN